jgi:lipoic acid synthetase
MKNQRSDYLRKPEWLKKKIKVNDKALILKKKLVCSRVHTVCQAASCPNINECFNKKIATFMILGDICTRNCSFCNIKKGTPDFFDFEKEIIEIVKLVQKYKYKYVTITSVTRDDLEDFGIKYFCELISKLKDIDVGVEVLIPDLNGNIQLLEKLVEKKPAVINHNIEMPESLYSVIRNRSDFGNSIEILSELKKIDSNIVSKSGFMLGLGETETEIFELIKILSETKIDILTIGQYLQPSLKHYVVKKYVEPNKFLEYKNFALTKKIKVVEAGPFVRSSYNAFESFKKVCNLK